MKVDIRDASVLQRLRPFDVVSYLRSTGWSRGDAEPRATIWLRDGEQPAEVLVPDDRGLADFAARMAEMLETLSAVERRSQLEILHDLTTAGHDVIRLRANAGDSGDGTIAIDAGTELIDNARDMLLAAAAATAERRSYFPTRKPAIATDYMDRVRLGQTEFGSYVVTLLSPVSPSLSSAIQQDLGLSEPFERKVTLTLARSLEALRRAAADAVSTGSDASFHAAVEDGVTANLCSAIVGMTEQLGEAAELEIRLSWSPARPMTDPLPAKVRFGSDAAPVLREAARIMKEAAPTEDYKVVGLVVGLGQRPEETQGRVTILSVSDDAPRSIRMTIAPANYADAIRAHENRLPVTATGLLVRQGPVHTLVAVHDFAVLDDLD